MKRKSPRKRFLTLLILSVSCFPVLASLHASAQYVSVNLVANTGGIALHTDPHLVDGWGLVSFPTSPWWVSDQNTSLSTLYRADGTVLPLVVDIPCISSGTPTVPCPVPGLFPVAPPFGPSGIVANVVSANGAFTVSQNGTNGPALFIFDALA